MEVDIGHEGERELVREVPGREGERGEHWHISEECGLTRASDTYFKTEGVLEINYCMLCGQEQQNLLI